MRNWLITKLIKKFLSPWPGWRTHGPHLPSCTLLTGTPFSGQHISQPSLERLLSAINDDWHRDTQIAKVQRVKVCRMLSPKCNIILHLLLSGVILAEWQKECKPEAVDVSTDSVFQRQQGSCTNKLRVVVIDKNCVNTCWTKSHQGGGGLWHEIPPGAVELLAIISYWERESPLSLGGQAALHWQSTHTRIFGQQVLV